MMGYSSRTATRTTIAAMREAGWGWIVGPLDQRGGELHGLPHVLDNGAWPAHLAGRPIDLPAFYAAVDRFGRDARFIVAPDIVGGGQRSLEFTMREMPALLMRHEASAPRILIAVQDGMDFTDVAPLLGGRIGIFVGGSTEWKLATLRAWGDVARERRCYLHCGRVNTRRRINLCLAAGADSFDGTSPVKFPKTLGLLDRARRQYDIEAWIGGRE